MNICPKCRAFYDDELLRFCLADGSPLVAVGRNETNWEVGESALRVVKQVAKRETAIQWIKQIVWTVVTTVIVVSVIYVVVMNTWIYLGGPDKYFPKTVDESTPTPTPTPVIKVESPTPTPVIEDLTPTPKPTPTTERTASPTPTPVIEDATPTPTPTPTPFICTQSMKEQAKTDIKSSNTVYIENSVAKLEKDDAIQYYRDRPPAGVSPEDVSNDGEMNFEAVDCSTATVTYKSTWVRTPEKYMRGLPPFKGVKKFRCDKIKDKKWVCSYVK